MVILSLRVERSLGKARGEERERASLLPSWPQEASSPQAVLKRHAPEPALPGGRADWAGVWLSQGPSQPHSRDGPAGAQSDGCSAKGGQGGIAGPQAEHTLP